MDQFSINIACRTFSLDCCFETTRAYFQKYLTDSVPEERISVTEAERIREQQLLDVEADREGLRRRTFTEPFLERASIQRKVARYLLLQDVVLLHGSTVCVDGYAYLFTAKTGVGKSTHTGLWRSYFGMRAVMLNDDRAFLAIHPGCITAYGSPWSGKHGLDQNINAPLAGISFLERGTKNQIRRLSPDLVISVRPAWAKSKG